MRSPQPFELAIRWRRCFAATLAFAVALPVAAQAPPTTSSPSPTMGPDAVYRLVDGKPTCSTEKASPNEADPCLRLGPLRLQQSVEAIEAILGQPLDTIQPGEPSQAIRIYSIPGEGEPYVAVTYQGRTAIELQASGASTSAPYEFSGIGLGDPAARIVETFGPPKTSRRLEDVPATLWDYHPLPYSFEIDDDKRVVSIKIWLP